MLHWGRLCTLAGACVAVGEVTDLFSDHEDTVFLYVRRMNVSRAVEAWEILLSFELCSILNASSCSRAAFD